jgi:Rrf2 family transcriptional regulator, iron-sulfur cluster assembly transcription factor
MKLSTRARYALRMMVEIARRPGTDLVSLGDVADHIKISKRYLDQLAIALKSSSLIRSMRGRGGGYQLARRADDISVAQIIEAAIGPINVVECVRHPEACLKSDGCECRWVYQRINDGIVNLLNGMSLAELATMGKSGLEEGGLPELSFSKGCPAT